MKTICRSRGAVHDLFVTRKGGMITLWSSGGVRHSVLDSAAPHLPGLEYARNMLAVLAFCPDPQSCLVLGLGGASIPRMLLSARPRIEVEAVEIDPAVVELATTYFDIGALPRFTIHLDEAAAFLARCTSRYGIIIVDTYVGETFPDQCLTHEFVQNARRCLLDDGVLAINWLNDDGHKREDLLKQLEWTIGPVWQLAGRKSHNFVYFAPTRKTSRHEIVSAAAAIEIQIPFENSLKRMVQHLRAPRNNAPRNNVD